MQLKKDNTLMDSTLKSKLDELQEIHREVNSI